MLDIRAHRRSLTQSSDSIQDSDIELLKSLAADQLRFGQSEEALLLLRLCQELRPTDPAVVLQLAQTFAALEEWAAADAMLAAHRQLSGNAVLRATDHLLRAVVAQSLKRLDAARGAFSDFLAQMRVEMGR